MKKLILFAIVAVVVSCGESNKENGRLIKKVVCDTVKTVSVDSAGVETITKVWSCDSTEEVAN